MKKHLLFLFLSAIILGCGASDPIRPAAPSSPTGLTAAAGNGQVIVSWTAVTGAESYNIYYGTAAGVTAAGTKIANAVSPKTITGLTNKTAYYFAVTAVNAGGESPLSSEVSTAPQLPGASAPATGSAINITDTYATLVGSFTNPASTTTESRFEWGTTTAYGTNTASLVYSDPGNIAPSAGISGLTAGTTYHYRFGIKTSDGTWWYGNDKTFTTTTLAAKTTIVSGLRYPAQFTVDANNVYWTEGIGSFNLYYSTVTGVTTAGTKVAGVTSGATVTGLTNGLTYFFKAAAVNGGVEGALSSEVSASLNPAAAGGILAAPANANVTAGDASVTISWTAVAGAASYNIYYDTVTPVTVAAANSKLGVTVTNSGVYTVAGGAALTNGTKYYFRVAAVSAGAVVGNLSAEVGVTPHAAVAAVPYWLGITAGVGQVTLTWTAETGVVKKAPLAGGAATTLASGLSNPVGIAADAANVYWTEQNSTSTGRGAVRKVPIAGPACAGTACTALATSLNNPQYIALDAANVYFTELGSFDTVSGMRKSDGTVNKVPVGGGAVTQLATALNGPQTISVDAANVYWTESANSVAGAGYIKKAPIAPGASQTLVSGLSGSQNIALDSTDVYFWSGYGALSKIAIGGGNAVEVTSGMSGTQPQAIDAANVYWTENTNGGTVKKINKANGNVSIIVGLDCTWCAALGIAQDSTYVYWMEGDVFNGTNWTGVGAIKKVAK